MPMSIDTNILYSAVQVSDDWHVAASEFVASLDGRDDVLISEFALLELYGLLRNPAIVQHPLGASQAVAVCQDLRANPRWQVVGLPTDSRDFHDAMWPRLGEPGFARRRAYDWRMALSLIRHGVDEFATANLKDFEGFGFKRVWNPLLRPRA